MCMVGVSLAPDVGRIGIGICYYIRFQELAMIYAVLICCATQEPHDNWSSSLGIPTESKIIRSWRGHSTLLGPFGEVLATTEHEEAIIIAEIDCSILEQRRTSLPLNKQRRGDLYQLVDLQRLNS
ncbi:hypothetical protein Rs2_06558 [Raphanus sativus]|nr:hypothetical protein Rs2_06558 [Raphanus sativus]